MIPRSFITRGLLALGIQVFALAGAASAQTLVLDTFNATGGTGSVDPNTSWIGNVTQTTGSITVGGTAKDENGWRANSLTINATGMGFLNLTAQRDAGHLAPSVVIQFEDFTLKTQIVTINASQFSVGALTPVSVALPAWPAGFDPTRITGWSLGGGTTGITAFRMTFENFTLSAAAPGGSNPPALTSQPAAQAVVAGSSATFTIAATNPVAGALTYRWYFTPAGSPTPQALSDQAGRFAGTQSPTLTVSNIQAADTGDFVAVVSNPGGFTTSNAARLSLEARIVRIVSQTAAPGAQVVVPIQLLAAGDENAVTFGLQFNPAKLTYVSYAAGADVAGGSVVANETLKNSGQLGFLVGKASGTVHAAGTRALLTLTFTVAAGVADDEIVPLVFADLPSARGIFTANSAQLPGAFSDGHVKAITGLEGDINGDGEVDGGDWVKLGRIVVGLDPAPAAGVAFLRADIAPRATKGDGTIDGGDWVQLGRYVVGLDPLQPAGGPATPSP